VKLAPSPEESRLARRTPAAPKKPKKEKEATA